MEKTGYKIIERNYTLRYGEIDIIAKDKAEYVFIEVKTRSNSCYGMPREAVDIHKQRQIYKCTKYYLHLHKLENALVRFDVIEIYLSKKKCKLNHLKDVIIKNS